MTHGQGLRSRSSRAPGAARRQLLWGGALTSTLLSLLGCAGSGDTEPVQVSVPVRVAAHDPAPSMNDLGWTVTLTEARVMAADFALRVGDEQHASLLTPLTRLLLPSAHAHPGHGAGGEIVGELLGRFVLDFAAPEPVAVGDATALLGPLSALDFTLVNATVDDLATADDPLAGAAAVLAGTATSDESAVSFVARLVVDEDRPVEAIPLAQAVSLTEGENPSLDLALVLEDPFEPDHFFDGVDFGALALDDDGVAYLGPRAAGNEGNGRNEEKEENEENANRLRRSLQAHDFYMTHVR